MLFPLFFVKNVIEIVISVDFVNFVNIDLFPIFSGNVVTPKRSSLNPQNVDKIVYLHENMKKVVMKYDFTLLPTKDPAEDPEEVVTLE